MSSLNECRRELQSIIQELDDIAFEINQSCSGIGQERCVACVKNAAERYREVKRSLDRVRPNVFWELVEGEG